jgi:succinyl-diaminopimelate desuccinylase
VPQSSTYNRNVGNAGGRRPGRDGRRQGCGGRRQGCGRRDPGGGTREVAAQAVRGSPIRVEGVSDAGARGLRREGVTARGGYGARGYAPGMELDLEAGVGELTGRLVDFESVSGDEGALADAIEEAVGGLGYLSVLRDGNAIVARTELGREQRVVLAGHIDTVPIADNVPSRVEGGTEGGTDGGTLFGCGSSDMKAGVAVQLKLAATVPEPVMDVTYVFYDCEEVESHRNGLLRLGRNCPSKLAADFAILLEPTGGVVEGGCQGTLRADIIARGERAHSARSWLGRNAIHAAGGILDVLRAYQVREPEVDGLVYHEGLNAVGIRGGVAGNVIPDECVVAINYRFAPDRSAEQAADYVRELFGDWEVEITDVAGGARPGLGHPAAKSFVAAMGGTPRAKLGWTDVARFDALGIPAVNYGPGDPTLAHTRGEHVSLAAIGDCESRMAAWLCLPDQRPTMAC